MKAHYPKMVINLGRPIRQLRLQYATAIFNCQLAGEVQAGAVAVQMATATANQTQTAIAP